MSRSILILYELHQTKLMRLARLLQGYNVETVSVAFDVTGPVYDSIGYGFTVSYRGEATAEEIAAVTAILAVEKPLLNTPISLDEIIARAMQGIVGAFMGGDDGTELGLDHGRADLNTFLTSWPALPVLVAAGRIDDARALIDDIGFSGSLPSLTLQQYNYMRGRMTTYTENLPVAGALYTDGKYPLTAYVGGMANPVVWLPIGDASRRPKRRAVAPVFVLEPIKP